MRTKLVLACAALVVLVGVLVTWLGVSPPMVSGQSVELVPFATRQCCVDTIADLRALSTFRCPCVTVHGYHTPGDGGGGDFYWDPASTEPDNRGTVIASNSQPPSGAWRRLMSGPVSINVKWFGATGDGTTNDAGAIQAAIEVIRGTVSHVNGQLDGGGIVDFPVGDYRIDAPIDAYSGIRLQGGGPASRLVEGPAFVGSERIRLRAIPGSSQDRYQGGEILNLEFKATSTVSRRSGNQHHWS